MKYKTIDLFAGIGGMRLAFEKYDFQTVYSNDFDKFCKITYDKNFKNSKLHLKDLKKVKLSEIPDFDFMLAGFPCQPFLLLVIGMVLKTKRAGVIFSFIWPEYWRKNSQWDFY